MCLIFITWKNSQKNIKERKQKRKTFNYLQLHKIYKLSSYTTNYIQRCMKNKRKKINY